MSILISFAIAFLLIGAYFSAMSWSVHISMVKDNHCPYGWANFKIFKREFDKYQWDWDSCYKSSLFNLPQGGYLHADIYKFDNKGMIMRDPISYLQSVLYIKKYIRNQIKLNKRKPKQKEIIKW